MGNVVLKRLLKKGCEIPLVLTRKEPGPFPYYKEDSLTELCRKKNIEFRTEFNWEFVIEKLRENRPCILLTATFHRIIPPEVINQSHLSFNIHPSLLPKYRGPDPITWVLVNNEKETGVTAHFLTNTPDAGGILVQKKIEILPNETKNSLVERLYLLSGGVVDELVEKILSDDLRFIPQNDSLASSYPKYEQHIDLRGDMS